MSAEIAIKLTGSEYRELVKAVEIVASQKQARKNQVTQRLTEITGNEFLGYLPVNADRALTDDEVAECRRLGLESHELDRFFNAMRAFLS